MKKILLIAFVALFSISNTYAQLPDGSVAPDFDLVDLNGTSHNLYSVLDQGYTVFLDFSAVWCGPCWSYHTGGTLEDLYENHGPAGMPGVSSNTTDDVMIFMIEGDGNSVDCLNGINCPSSYGDWVTGTMYPIICTDGTMNTTAITSDYSIGYWPTIYMVCPDRLTTEVGQSSNPYGSVSACPPPASNNNDARTFGYMGETLTCEGDLTPEILIQNYGLVPLTSLTIDVTVNGSPVSSTPWSGNLSTYGTDNVTLPVLSGLANNDAVAINVSQPNGGIDADPSNNPAVAFYVSMATQNTHTYVTINIITDAYGSETTWNIKNSMGQTVASGGPYNDLSASGTTTQTPTNATLDPTQCHTFTILDSYGDGIDAGYGAGSFSVVDGNGTTLASGGVFTDEDGAAWKTGNSASASWDCDQVTGCFDPGTGAGQYGSLTACTAACAATDVNETNSNLSVYPNPVKDVLTINGIYKSVEIYDIYGKLVLSSNAKQTIDVSSLADGIYSVNINTNNAITVKKITITK